jgi:hypothetical protein
MSILSGSKPLFHKPGPTSRTRRLHYINAGYLEPSTYYATVGVLLRVSEFSYQTGWIS